MAIVNLCQTNAIPYNNVEYNSYIVIYVDLLYIIIYNGSEVI